MATPKGCIHSVVHLIFVQQKFQVFSSTFQNISQKSRSKKRKKKTISHAFQKYKYTSYAPISTYNKLGASFKIDFSSILALFLIICCPKN